MPKIKILYICAWAVLCLHWLCVSLSFSVDQLRSVSHLQGTVLMYRVSVWIQETVTCFVQWLNCCQMPVLIQLYHFRGLMSSLWVLLPLLRREWTRWSQTCAPVPPSSPPLDPSAPLTSSPASEMSSSSSSTSTSEGETLRTHSTTQNTH